MEEMLSSDQRPRQGHSMAVDEYLGWNGLAALHNY